MRNIRKSLGLPHNGPTGCGVSVALVDTGIDATHPDLRSAVDVEASRQCFPPHSDLRDYVHHGTHLAGIIAGASIPGHDEFRGIAPDARLLSFKVTDNGVADEVTLAQAIRAAIGAKADILNLSLTGSPTNGLEPPLPPPWVWPAPGPRRESLLENALTCAARAGVLCVVSAGNDGDTPSSINPPAGLRCVLTVAALDPSSAPYPRSSRGPYRTDTGLLRNGVRGWWPGDSSEVVVLKPDLAVSGVGVMAPHSGTCRRRNGPDHQEIVPTNLPSHTYIRESGTSQAAAVVSGIAACMLQVIRDAGVELGANPACTLRNLLRVAAARGRCAGEENALGCGILLWRNVEELLGRYVHEPLVRAGLTTDCDAFLSAVPVLRDYWSTASSST